MRKNATESHDFGYLRDFGYEFMDFAIHLAVGAQDGTLGIMGPDLVAFFP